MSVHLQRQKLLLVGHAVAAAVSLLLVDLPLVHVRKRSVRAPITIQVQAECYGCENSARMHESAMTISLRPYRADDQDLYKLYAARASMKSPDWLAGSAAGNVSAHAV